MMTLASYLATVKTNRCGFIPYTIVNGALHFLLTRHKPTRDLGDFGGGVRKTEFALMAGLRELHEESHGIFSHIYKTANDVGNSVAIVDGDSLNGTHNMAIVFVSLENKWIEDAQQAFVNNPPTKKRSDEVSELVWVNESTFLALINGRPSKDVLWSRIQSFLRKTYRPKTVEVHCALRAMASVSC